MSTYVIICTDPDGLPSSSSSGSSPEEEISVSTVAATAVGGAAHHLLKVSDYSLLKATHTGKNGGCIESRAFHAGGHAWKLGLYLNGAKPEHAGFLSLHLSLADADAAAAAVLAEFEVALVHHPGTLLRRPPSRAASATRAFSAEARRWGWPRFIAVEDLERSAFLRDDCFAVRCRVAVVEERRPRVEEGVVQAQDVQRLGLLCRCSDAACRRHHATPAQTLWEGFARLCRSIFE